MALENAYYTWTVEGTVNMFGTMHQENQDNKMGDVGVILST